MESPLRRTAYPPDLRLIETMLWDGAALPRLPLHLARMAAGAEALGWDFPEAAIRAELAGISATGPRRARLTLGAGGDVALELSPLPPAKPLWRLGLAQVRLRSDDPWLTIKSTMRAPYDSARAALPQGIDEALLLNERGEVCDGTITTVFFDRGEGLRTPPLTCGLLPGVLRAELAAREEPLLPADLPSVKLWVGNALRGLIAAEWAG